MNVFVYSWACIIDTTFTRFKNNTETFIIIDNNSHTVQQSVCVCDSSLLCGLYLSIIFGHVIGEYQQQERRVTCGFCLAFFVTARHNEWDIPFMKRVNTQSYSVRQTTSEKRLLRDNWTKFNKRKGGIENETVLTWRLQLSTWIIVSLSFSFKNTYIDYQTFMYLYTNKCYSLCRMIAHQII